MAPRIPLPEPLRSNPFALTTAVALGIGRGRLAGPDLITPYRGVRSATDAEPALLYSPRLRVGDRFSHTTALRLWGVPLPRLREREVHVTATSGSRHRMGDVVGHESAPTRVSRRAGLPVSSPMEAYLESAPLLELDDLVAVADHLVLDPRRLDPLEPRPYVSLTELRLGASSFRGRGALVAREAASLARDAVESPRETKLRLILARARLPEPECGFELARAGGRTIGWFDLAWPQWRVIAEYDGDLHRTSTVQYERDISRFDAADELGWKVIRVRDAGIRNPHATVARVRQALLRAGWQPEPSNPHARSPTRLPE